MKKLKQVTFTEALEHMRNRGVAYLDAYACQARRIVNGTFEFVMGEVWQTSIMTVTDAINEKWFIEVEPMRYKYNATVHGHGVTTRLLWRALPMEFAGKDVCVTVEER